jgi:sugar phosphate isomerase/epimerase
MTPTLTPDIAPAFTPTPLDTMPPGTRRYAFSSASLGDTPLLTDVRLARAAGYEAIELHEAKLEHFLAAGGTLEELRDALGAAGIRPLTLTGAPREASPDGARMPTTMLHCGELCTRAAAIGCEYVVVGADRVRPSSAPGAAVVCLAASLRVMAHIAEAHGVRLAFAPAATRHSAIASIATARDVLTLAGEGRVSLVLDTFDFYAAGSTWSMLDGLPPEAIAVVRVSDTLPLPLESLADTDRLLPGDGGTPLRDLLRRIEELGYTGFYSSVLASAAYPGWDPAQLTLVAHESLEGCFAELDDREGRLDYG